MITTVILLILFNLLLNKYIKHISNHGGVILKNIKLISKVYDYMKKILILYKADRVAITKIGIEDGYILKQMIHEVSVSGDTLIPKLKRIPMEHGEYVRIKKYDELHKSSKFLNEITIPHEMNVLSDEGVTHVIHIKLIDKIIQEKTDTADRSMSFYYPAQLEALSEVRLKVSQIDCRVLLPKPSKVIFTYEDLEKAYNDGYKNGMMNEAGLECTLFSSWYNWVHEIKGKNRSEA
jgi:hypothetical protein